MPGNPYSRPGFDSDGSNGFGESQLASQQNIQGVHNSAFPSGVPWAGMPDYGRMAFHNPNAAMMGILGMSGYPSMYSSREDAASRSLINGFDSQYGAPGIGAPTLTPTARRAQAAGFNPGGMTPVFDRFAGVYGAGGRDPVLDQDAANTDRARANEIQTAINSGQVSPANRLYAQRQADLASGNAGNISDRLWGPMLPYQQNYMKAQTGAVNAGTADQQERTQEMAGMFPVMLQRQQLQNQGIQNMLPYGPKMAQSGLDAQAAATAAQTERTREMAGMYPGMLTAQGDQNKAFESTMPLIPKQAQANLQRQQITNQAIQNNPQLLAPPAKPVIPRDRWKSDGMGGLYDPMTGDTIGTDKDNNRVIKKAPSDANQQASTGLQQQQTPGRALSAGQAGAYMQRAGGDKNKAKAMAAADGFDPSLPFIK